MSLEALAAIGLAGVGGIVWLIRLEGVVKNSKEISKLRIDALKDKADAMEDQIQDLQEKHTTLDTKIVEQLSAVKESLAGLVAEVRALREKTE